MKQRLRLAAVSEKLLDVYAEDGMTLEQLMAFTVTNDHARQEQVWETLQRSYSQEPYQIRRMLTENTVRASDRRALFVGLDAYEQAGGIVMRDLFQQDDGGWLQDVGLLDRLVTEKLKAEAETIAAEGWKWIEVTVDFPYGHTHRSARTRRHADRPHRRGAGDDRCACNAEYAKLEAEYEDADELPDEVDARLGEIETALAAFEDRPVSYDPAEIARAGVFVSIDCRRQPLRRSRLCPAGGRGAGRRGRRRRSGGRRRHRRRRRTILAHGAARGHHDRRPARSRRRTRTTPSSRCRIGSSAS